MAVAPGGAAIVIVPQLNVHQVSGGAVLQEQGVIGQSGHEVTIDVEKDCVLWDKKCTADRDKALKHFFGVVLPSLSIDPCFTHGAKGGYPCSTDPDKNPSASVTSTVKSWLRKPECMSSAAEAKKLLNFPKPPSGPCCGECGVGGPNVDVYYWPEPDANTECLSIIGTGVAPLTEGASTATGGFMLPNLMYWGFQTTTYNRGLHKSVPAVITTALYTSINNITFKMPLVNPWDQPSTSGIPSNSAQNRSSLHNTQGTAGNPTNRTFPLHARAYPIPIRPRAPLNDSKPGRVQSGNVSHHSIMTVDGHTFTSPTIYVNFYSLSATDDCGFRGDVVRSTILAFDPGELSTVAGPLVSFVSGKDKVTSRYNFADLPCPPTIVMKQQWYKPEHGNPYRPVIAFPSKVLDILPQWKQCKPDLFLGFDPPRTLEPAKALDPMITPPADAGPKPEMAAPVNMHEHAPVQTKKQPEANLAAAPAADPTPQPDLKPNVEPSLKGSGEKEEPLKGGQEDHGEKSPPNDPKSPPGPEAASPVEPSKENPPAVPPIKQGLGSAPAEDQGPQEGDPDADANRKGTKGPPPTGIKPESTDLEPQPAVAEPAMPLPGVELPAPKPIPHQPAPPQPAMMQPAAGQPVRPEPAKPQPVAGPPADSLPLAPEAAMPEPASHQPAAAQPGAAQAKIEKPVNPQGSVPPPTGLQVAAAQPEAPRPVAANPPIPQPANTLPVPAEVAALQPTVAQPQPAAPDIVAPEAIGVPPGAPPPAGMQNPPTQPAKEKAVDAQVIDPKPAKPPAIGDAKVASPQSVDNEQANDPEAGAYPDNVQAVGLPQEGRPLPGLLSTNDQTPDNQAQSVHSPGTKPGYASPADRVPGGSPQADLQHDRGSTPGESPKVPPGQPHSHLQGEDENGPNVAPLDAFSNPGSTADPNAPPSLPDPNGRTNGKHKTSSKGSSMPDPQDQGADSSSPGVPVSGEIPTGAAGEFLTPQHSSSGEGSPGEDTSNSTFHDSDALTDGVYPVSDESSPDKALGSDLPIDEHSHSVNKSQRPGEQAEVSRPEQSFSIEHGTQTASFAVSSGYTLVAGVSAGSELGGKSFASSVPGRGQISTSSGPSRPSATTSAGASIFSSNGANSLGVSTEDSISGTAGAAEGASTGAPEDSTSSASNIGQLGLGWMRGVSLLMLLLMFS